MIWPVFLKGAGGMPTAGNSDCFGIPGAGAQDVSRSVTNDYGIVTNKWEFGQLFRPIHSHKRQLVAIRRIGTIGPNLKKPGI